MTVRWYDPVKYPYQFKEPPKGTMERSGWGRCWNLQCTTPGKGGVGWYPTHLRVPVYLDPQDAMSKRYVCSTNCKEEVEVARRKAKAAEVFGEDTVRPGEAPTPALEDATTPVTTEDNGGVESNDALDERRSDEEKVGSVDTDEGPKESPEGTSAASAGETTVEAVATGDGDPEAIFNECKIGPTDTAPHLTRNDVEPPKDKTMCGRKVLEVTSGPVRGFQTDKRCKVCAPIAARHIKKTFGRDA